MVVGPAVTAALADEVGASHCPSSAAFRRRT